MIEPEMAFYEINDNMNLAEDFLKYLLTYALENCKDDLEFLSGMYDKELIERLNFIINSKFERITYTTAVDVLKRSGEKFEYPVSWGVDLQTEHERYLVEKFYKKPVIVTDYPAAIKAFYMKLNDDGKTVRGMDVLFPKIGEIIGGSQREENLDNLGKRIKELKLPVKDLWWYLDTRKYGTAPHSGFGLGFERLLLFVTGMSNIRDVIPFPRFPKNADF
jgi:asparaginyl-tRNA synthetase